ncbi:MAG: S49 family peptidase, partial [Burkholderiales bacterium]|nr:S49 family peptidase [Burkholderiales bacterium]
MADDNNKDWERSVLERLAFSALKEQRRARRWSIFFKLLGFAYLTLFLILALDWRPAADSGQGHTALVEIDGVIATDGDASAENIVSSLQAAFKDKNTRGVILRINSPGGSPVQAGIIYEEIRRLRGQYPDIPI